MSGKVLEVAAPCQLDFEIFDHAPLESNEVRIKTLYSGISAGTELTQYRGTTLFLHKRWDADNRLFLPDDAIALLAGRFARRFCTGFLRAAFCITGKCRSVFSERVL